MENKFKSIKNSLLKQCGYMIKDHLTEKDSILIVLKKDGQAAYGHRYGGDIGLKEVEELLNKFGAYEDQQEFVASSGSKVTIVR